VYPFQPAPAAASSHCPELNPVERFGGPIKAQLRNRLYPDLNKLEDHIIAAAKLWTSPDKVSGLIHSWLSEKANLSAQT
jgi:hypothetical protein